MGVEGVVFRANSNEVAEAELLQDMVRAVILFYGEEGSAEALFQLLVECRVDDDGLYRVRAPGVDHTQIFAEGRCLLESYSQDVGVDRCGVGFAADDRVYGVQVGPGAEYSVEEALVRAGLRQLV